MKTQAHTFTFLLLFAIVLLAIVLGLSRVHEAMSQVERAQSPTPTPALKTPTLA
jgi:hypothetical protein